MYSEILINVCALCCNNGHLVATLQERLAEMLKRCRAVTEISRVVSLLEYYREGKGLKGRANENNFWCS